ncbi:MAG TPA: SH3 domain-containing protein [Terriglobales bacterium]|nr:SH3 domain-containing protein [Terriglobales bacterium]
MKIERRQLNVLSAITVLSRVVFALVAVLLLAVICAPQLFAASSSETALLVQINAPEADVLRAVQEVTEDQIIHGTYSYEKERTLYGAHAANAARVFGKWDQPGKVFYKVADNVLAPKFFKDSQDVGTISVRYVIQPIEAGTTSVRIDAIFVDARNVKHASKGSVEAAEYGAIQQHIQSLQTEQKQTEQAAQEVAAERAARTAKVPAARTPADPGDSWSLGLTVPQLEQRVAELRREVELLTRESGASLKAAPYRSAATLASLPARTQVAVEVLTPYWYGVETEDGHRGWIHRSEVEPLP